MIEGSIVNLRAFDIDDAAHMFRWRNDAEVVEYLNVRYPTPLVREGDFMRRRGTAPQSFTNAHFVVETKDGLPIGHVGLNIASAEDRNAHLGMMIGEKDHWSRGYGADALKTLLRFAFGEMNLHRVDLTVDAANVRGIACYRKCGFVEEGRLRDARYQHGEFADQVVMGILRPEFYAGEESVA